MAKGHPVFAAFYDRGLQAIEQQGLAALREQMVRPAAGAVREVGIGAASEALSALEPLWADAF